MNRADPNATRLDKEFKHDWPLVACRFDPAGRFVFAGADGNTVQRWELTSGKATVLTGHDSWVRAIGFSPDSATLYTGGYDGRLIFWPAADEQPKPVRTIEAHKGWIRNLSVSSDGKLLATCGNDNLVKLWSTADGTLVREMPGHANHVYNVAFHPSGEFVVSADLKGAIKQWDVADGHEVRQFDAPVLHVFDKVFRADIGGARGMAFSADGKLLALSGIIKVTNAFAGIGNPAVLSFEWESGKLKLQHDPKEKGNGVLWNVRFHSDGYWIGASGGGAGGFLFFWKLDGAQEFFKFKLPNQAHDFDLHSDGLRMGVAHQDGTLRVYTMGPKG